MTSAAISAHPPTAPHPGHDTTPQGRPSWYGDRLAREERSWLSKTGDVEIYAGNTFGVPYTSLGDAIERAREASQDAGAVFVMRPSAGDAHAGQYWLTRAYNAEYTKHRGLYVGQSDFNGREKLTHLHRELFAVVDGDFLVTPRR